MDGILFEPVVFAPNAISVYLDRVMQAEPRTTARRPLLLLGIVRR